MKITVNNRPRDDTRAEGFEECRRLVLLLMGRNPTSVRAIDVSKLNNPFVTSVVCTCGALSEPDYSDGDHTLDCPRFKPSATREGLK